MGAVCELYRAPLSAMKVISLIFRCNIHTMKYSLFHDNFIALTNYFMAQENFMIAVAMNCQIFMSSVHEFL